MFWVTMMLVLVDTVIMVLISSPYASDDLTVVWLATVDMSRGIFHEPFFYGQDYGVMLEAILTAPFVHFGADPTEVVPVVMGILGIAPFISFAVFEFLRGDRVAAMLFVTMPMLLPVQHGLQITALNGIAVIAFYPWLQMITTGIVRHVLVALVLTGAVFVNPNALVIGLPLGGAYFLQQDRRWRTVPWLVLGALPTVIGWIASRSFYSDRAGNVINTLFDWRLEFKPELISEALGQLDLHMAWTCPIFGKASSLVLLILTLTAIVLIKKRDTASGSAILVTLTVILISFGFAKVHDGTGSIFFPLSRMFLGIPILLAWSLSGVRIALFRMLIVPIVCIATLGNGAVRWATGRHVYAEALVAQSGLPLRTKSIQEIKALCGQVAVAAVRSDAEHILVLPGLEPYTAHFVAYATPVLFPEAPLTWMVRRDRRVFQRGSLLASKAERFLLVHCGMNVQKNASVPGPDRLDLWTEAGNGRTVAAMIETFRSW